MMCLLKAEPLKPLVATYGGWGGGGVGREWKEGLLELVGLTYHSPNPKAGVGST